MRTTLNIDDDLVRLLKQCAHKTRTPLRRIVNAALRKGLNELRPARPEKPYKCPTFRMGEPTVSLDKALTLAAALEDAEVLREMRMRK
jgi:hypothetical protein